ncbi:Glutamine--scyllo-inositol transaminase [Acetoanaerobium sticklandii]|uniref:Glutamine--scyllo-inositol transaminase n=1 Tax=Acetoanaerobium sticklandii (strain ATCC 12662 / DSM 519 / JCM 1433 / CCUG 9281 / NCIMB 10654 / HF) TaxID=499177 RepID=E3PUM0_ACESD|nr:DegT/DnrJ/EryC1/StrS family aminotransferase [Acetoanaerobium sticklandii]CBH22458.1 Glutamine--scyllo-inositol transaminase [Acetoanaerobium sticklandii]
MIKLSMPDVGLEEFEQIKEVLDSGYLVQGAKVDEFENLVKNYLKAKHVVAVSSGTAALHLALLALDIKAGDEVIIPDFTFPATANVVEILGATPVFVDTDLDSFCIDTKKIEEKISSRTKAIMPVQEFGQSSDMNKILELANHYNLKVIEDAACAFGSEYKSYKVGTIGEIGCFSLHPRKAITTGEGGLLVTNNDEYAEKIRILRNHGIKSINGKANFVMPGLNYRLTNIQGAIGVAQMAKLESINKSRKTIADLYYKLLKNNTKIILPKEMDYGKHVWQTYHILIDKKYIRDEVIMKLKQKGIETNFGANSVHMQPYYKGKYNLDSNTFNNSVYSFNQGLALPLHPNLNEDDINFIVNSLCEILT